MIPITDLLLFALAAFGLVISPGPNMIYLISRSITQGRKAGLISLAGVICGFLFHIVMVSFNSCVVCYTVCLYYFKNGWCYLSFVPGLAGHKTGQQKCI